jgi:hypothetical protein
MFKDRDGGAITSLHNFELGVVANDADQARHDNWVKAQTEKLDRSDYEKDLPKERKAIFQQQENIVDAYTTAELPKDGRASRDHTVSVSEIERSSRGHLAQTREERVATANLDANKAWTETSLNSSKGDADLLDWASRPSRKDPSKTNAEYFGADTEAMIEQYEAASNAVDAVQDQAVFDKQMDELWTEGTSAAGKLALRQILGLLLKDLIEGLVQDVRHLVRVGFEGAQALWDLVESRIKETYARVRAKWMEYLKEGVGAGVSAFLSNLLTLVVNAFVTTAKNIVRMIREAVMAIVRAVKTIVAPAPGASGADIAMDVLKILSSTVAACIGIALEEVIAKALQSIVLLAPFATTLAPIAAGIVTGGLTLFVVLAFDRLRNHIAFRNKQLADVHRGQAVNYLRIKQTVLLLDASYTKLKVSNEALAAQFKDSQRVIDREREATQKSLRGYRSSVDALDQISEKIQ